MEYLIAFLIVMVFIFIGEWVSTFSKAYIPSIFISAILFIIGFWTFLPEDIAVQASFGDEFIAIIVPVLLVHLGTMMDIRQLVDQWRAVAIALTGALGASILTMIIGTILFDWHTVAATIPPLIGGVVSTALMTEGLQTEGLTMYLALPVAMYILQSFVGYPLTSLMLKKEGQRLLKTYDPSVQVGVEEKGQQETKQSPKFIKVSSQYKTSAFVLAKVAFVALLAMGLSQLTNEAIDSSICALVLGVIAHQIGFLEKNVLNQAKVFNWLMYGLMAYIFSQLNTVTPEILQGIIIQTLILLLLGVLGMFGASTLLAKTMKMSTPMAFATSLTALCGFPSDYILTSEVIHHLTSDEKQRNYLLEHMMPKMLVGGFATVSIASILIASILLRVL
ncbi:hypothetical protein [Tetragenococcus muriaticus]|uniref:Uncharacterized protein n=2 Tax=Tetragenococcus TaxID=51668 RepID=A0A091C7N9_9ENTE|nr:hypothetical protein [Tetragenococcus muriaticus]KFN92710.1 hypothetical protein TMU3MR103_0363 [Tetragenococcus muriaticus 3MR10-3]